MKWLKKTESPYCLLVCDYFIFAFLFLLWLSEFGSLSLTQYWFWILVPYLDLDYYSNDSTMLIP